MDNINLAHFNTSIENMRRSVVGMRGAVEGISKFATNDSNSSQLTAGEPTKIISLAHHIEKDEKQQIR